MISYFQSIILGGLQGVTELFPISSLGHSIILPGLLHWHLDQNTNDFLMFLVATHFATAVVLFLFYWKDWKRIIRGIFLSLKKREIVNLDARLGWLLIVSTIPAGLVGLLFQEQLKTFFASPIYASIFLIANGIMLFIGERLRKKAKMIEDTNDADKRIAMELSWWQSIKIGAVQIIALVPGFSRTGSTIMGGLLVGLSHEDALRYSFLLAAPIIGAAAVLKLPELLSSGSWYAISVVLLGATTSAITAYLSVKFLTKYFKTNTLVLFAFYCILAGLVSLVLLAY